MQTTLPQGWSHATGPEERAGGPHRHPRMALGKGFYGSINQALTLLEQTKKNTDDIREMRQELKALTATVQRPDFEAKRDRELAAKDGGADLRDQGKDRDSLILRLENHLLRFERRLVCLAQNPALEGPS